MSQETETPHASALHQESSADSAGSVVGILTTAVVELAALVGTLGWTAFWLNIARLHLVADSMVGMDAANAAFTVAVMVVPVVGAYVWRLAGRPELPSVGALFDRRAAGEPTDT